MAQLNPNFEIDFNDINSYEQIQLINDTRLAKENLLMHKAYKEPAEDAIIQNQFSSFTFVDFCPKLFTQSGANSSTSRPGSRPASRSTLRHRYELETFSDLFERINQWLRVNKDWRVISLETLIFDCTSQFNHVKSSIYSRHLPRNMRGLRLYLSPSKSRFSGPQKIGCINVVPRKVSGDYMRTQGEPLEYETLDEILSRLNELLLTRPIEGRILSVETITLPIVNGYVNTETNYFMDSRLNALDQSVFGDGGGGCRPLQANEPSPSIAVEHQQGLIDILRVYYEFGPMLCGLVNVIDFVPRFHHTAASSQDSQQASDQQSSQQQQQQQQKQTLATRQQQQIGSTESLTRLIRRSLAWFENERKRILRESGEKEEPVNLKVCNLQVHRKVLPKHQLLQVSPENALERLGTRQMFYGPQGGNVNNVRRDSTQAGPASACDLDDDGDERSQTPLSALVAQDNGQQRIYCAQCQVHMPSCGPANEWCLHFADLADPYEVRFVRLAYVVPVLHLGGLARAPPTCRDARPKEGASPDQNSADTDEDHGQVASPQITSSSFSASTSSDSSSSSSSSSSSAASSTASSASSGESSQEEEEIAEVVRVADRKREELQPALLVVRSNNERHLADELAHQLSGMSLNNNNSNKNSENTHDKSLSGDGPIGQLSYRLFAPCQLVNSSSCFSINPVNSSSPLARRGSVDLNGGGSSSNHTNHQACLSSDQAQPATSGLFSGSQQQLVTCHEQVASSSSSTPAHHHHHQQPTISFGAFFPALSNDLIPDHLSLMNNSTNHINSSASLSAQSPIRATAPTQTLTAPTGLVMNNNNNNNNKFTSNEFESVDAIRRRMEIYVTTNSMKVLAGETLVVNLNDALSCLSTAIEQTILKASFSSARSPSTWVSVYVLYAAVDEPHLPRQLLEQQRRRELGQITEEEAASEERSLATWARKCPSPVGRDNSVPVFEDDFREEPARRSRAKEEDMDLDLRSGSKRRIVLTKPTEEINEEPSTSIYNCAYDRTVPLPSSPDELLQAGPTNTSYLDPAGSDDSQQQQQSSAGLMGTTTTTTTSNCADSLVHPSLTGMMDLLGEQHYLCLDEHELIEAQSARGLQLSDERCRKLQRRLERQQRRAGFKNSGAQRQGCKPSSGKKKKKRVSRSDSQCSII